MMLNAAADTQEVMDNLGQSFGDDIGGASTPRGDVR
jgi:hypothetical protein